MKQSYQNIQNEKEKLSRLLEEKKETERKLNEITKPSEDALELTATNSEHVVDQWLANQGSEGARSTEKAIDFLSAVKQKYQEMQKND